MKRLISIFCMIALIISVIFSISLPVSANGYDIMIDFESDQISWHPDGWQSVDSDLVSFYDSEGQGLVVSDYGYYADSIGLGIGILPGSDMSSALIMEFSMPMDAISLDFGYDITLNDWAVLTLFNGTNQIDQVQINTTENGTMDQTISFEGGPFTKAEFMFSAEACETVDNIYLSLFDVSESKPTGNHELVTLLSNPADSTGIRTMDLNYYLNDPVIWQSTVKNITVWLESEIFDLTAAKQKAMLPAGQTLLKDYNIRLMMKIVYNDGTVETKEVNNVDIARNIPVLIPVDEFAGISDLGIVYIDTKGDTAVMPVTPVMIDGMNYLKFENNHFSEYGVISNTAHTPSEQQPYIIQSGDTLTSIAAKFGVTVQSLVAANNISNPDMIYAGNVLVIA